MKIITWLLYLGGISVGVAIIYSIYLTKKNAIKGADFVKECSKFLDSLATNSGHLLILGDFRQYVQERTHRHGHILDFVMSRDDDNLIKGISVSSMLSNHFLIYIDVSLQKTICFS